MLILSLCSLFGCKDRFLPNTIFDGPKLVVDGMIDNQPGPYTVTLSRSLQLGKTEFKPYEDCKVIIRDDAGNQERLTEKAPGLYKTRENGIQGVVGRSYQIHIETPDGVVYESDFQKMKASTPIDSIYTKKELDLSRTEDNPDIPGYRFYVDTKRAPKENTYLLWQMEETYEYTSDYHLEAVFTMGQIHYSVNRTRLYRCWKTRNVHAFYTAHTSNLADPVIKNQPLHFVGTDTKRLQVRYSLLLHQYAIGKEAYDYWNSLENQMSEEFYLYSSQPYQVEGNVARAGNPDKPALGYFTVGSVESKRIYVERPPFEFYYEVCQPVPDISSLAYRRANDDSIYLTYSNFQGDLVLSIASKGCIDCRSEGGELNKPDFWEEEEY